MAFEHTRGASSARNINGANCCCALKRITRQAHLRRCARATSERTKRAARCGCGDRKRQNSRWRQAKNESLRAASAHHNKRQTVCARRRCGENEKRPGTSLLANAAMRTSMAFRCRLIHNLSPEHFLAAPIKNGGARRYRVCVARARIFYLA